MASVTLRGLTKIFPGGALAVDNVNLEVGDGEAMVLLGPSGCGKSTLLRLVAGLEEPTQGDVYLDGELANDLPPRARNVAMIFQNFALYPHMSVEGNIAFPLHVRRFAPERVNERVTTVASGLGLGKLLSRRPGQLSGGQQQRVAMGRAIARDPDLFLMDEPLSNLDTVLRRELRTEISTTVRRLGVTTLYVTHDQAEALAVADRIAIMRRGSLVDLGTPDQVYSRPATTYVATFLGTPRMSLLSARVEALADHQVRLHFGSQALRIPATDFRTRPLAHFRGEQVTMGIRPEAIRPVSDTAPGALRCMVAHVEHLGHESLGHLWMDAEAVPVEDPMAEDSGESPNHTPRLWRRTQDLFRRRRTPEPPQEQGDAGMLNAGRHGRRQAQLTVRLPPHPGLKPGHWLALEIDLAHVHFFDMHGHRIDVGLT